MDKKKYLVLFDFDFKSLTDAMLFSESLQEDERVEVYAVNISEINKKKDLNGILIDSIFVDENIFKKTMTIEKSPRENIYDICDKLGVKTLSDRIEVYFPSITLGGFSRVKLSEVRKNDN